MQMAFQDGEGIFQQDQIIFSARPGPVSYS